MSTSYNAAFSFIMTPPTCTQSTSSTTDGSAPRRRRRGDGRRDGKRPSNNDNHPRLFIAIALPIHVRQQLNSLALSTLPKLRAPASETLHVTLHFLGTAPLQPLRDALRTVRVAPFRIGLASLGAFPSIDSARVLWAGVRHDDDALQLLYEKVGEVVRQVGLKTETRSFSPHVTIGKVSGSGRKKKRTPEIEEFVKEHASFNTGEFDVDEFVLYESVIEPNGSVYVPLQTYALGHGDCNSGRERFTDERGAREGNEQNPTR